MEDTLENLNAEKPTVPQAVKTLSIFAYIGNGFWGLVILIVILWALAASASFERIMNLQVLEPGALLAGGLIAVVLCALPIFGAAMMTKGKKSGFWLYAVSNGLWVLLNFASGVPQNIFVGAISLGFIIGFATQLKNLR